MLNLTQSLLRLWPTRHLSRLIITSLLAVLLVSCATGPRMPTSLEGVGVEYIAEFEQMAADGLFLDAALAYSKLASSSEPTLRNNYSLRAAELLMSGNYIPQSFQLMSEIDTSSITPDLQVRLSFLAAQIALARQMPDEALTKLETAGPLIRGEDTRLQLKYHKLRADAFAQQNHHLETARERVILESLLTDPDAIQANQESILSSLRLLTPEAIRTFQTGAPPDVFKGWLELASIGQSMADSHDGAELDAWRKRYPQHPALPSIIDSIVSARPRALSLPTQIALILPLNNRFAKAASAVRDGFLAAYYAQPANTEGPSVVVPSIRIYDEGDNAEQIDFAYEQAINDGAEFVVGPLNKEAVNQLASRDNLPVPVLALNFSEHHGHELPEKLPDNLYQISLSPEQEARQAAEKAWLDGHSRAAIISPANAWGVRVARAFSERWLQFGGSIVEKQTYDANESDYSLPIRRLLNVDDSEQRKRDLRQLIGSSIEFIPRRRQDVDFIFMAASSRQARLIRPQLRFHHAPKLPVYATSHSYGGTVNSDMDRDMDGVQFSDMPWTLIHNGPNSPLKMEISQNWPEQEKRFSRLYALGIDAYHIIGQLNSLRRNRADFYKGETGDLYLDVSNRLQRRLIWARFDRGIPIVLNDF